jgi:hypothetical protein
LGYIELDHFGDTGAGFRDQLQLGFAKITTSVASPLFALTSLDRPPLGTCAAGYNGAANPLQLVGALDGGSTFTVKGPGGTMTVTANLGDKVPLSATGAFLVPGDYTITGAGGKDVGPFTATINIPISPTLTNPAAAKSLTVSRTQPMTVTWNPNGSTGHLELVLEVYPDANTAGIVTCLVPASAGSFTIPSYVLSSLPTGGGARFSFQLGDRVGAATSSIFSAPGIDFGLAQSFIDGVILNGVTITN